MTIIDIVKYKFLKPINGRINPNRKGPIPTPKSNRTKNVEVASPIRSFGAMETDIV